MNFPLRADARPPAPPPLHRRHHAARNRQHHHDQDRPRISELSITVCSPSSSFTMPSAMAPSTGPISVPRPPTMTQMMTSAADLSANTLGVTISAQLANRQPDNPAIAALMLNNPVL
jgi:hypothetical protein